jgi:hypothetical protein
MAKQLTQTADSFRVPNSIVQGLTTHTSSDLNRLSAFQMVTLLGLLSKVSPRAPEKEVGAKLSEILEVIEVGRQVAHTVERTWTNQDDKTQQKQYHCRRYNPYHLRRVNETLLALFETTAVVRRRDEKTNRRFERQVHVLDSFGYCYRQDGKFLDFDDLPAGSERYNVGSESRPVWRVRQQNEDGDFSDRPCGVVFRINKELADELAGRRGTLNYTIFARKLFSLLRRYMMRPAIIRLIILVLRQTGGEFSRKIEPVIDELGFDATHPSRAIEQLREALHDLQQLRLVNHFEVDIDNGKLTIERNKDWYQEDMPEE